jgi:hypothetical protein
MSTAWFARKQNTLPLFAGGYRKQYCGEGGICYADPMGGSSKANQQSLLRLFLFVRIPAKASSAVLLTNKKSRYRGTLLGCFCGEGGIRTLGTV